MRILYSLLSSLPLNFLYVISSIISSIISTFYRKDVVLENLYKSFPNESDKKIIKIKKRFYKNFCDIIFETIKLYSISKKELSSRVTFENIDVINNHVSNKERVDVLTSHQCNWEWLALAAEINLKTSLHFIYKKWGAKFIYKLSFLLFENF